jgi:hypothetical protein
MVARRHGYREDGVDRVIASKDSAGGCQRRDNQWRCGLLRTERESSEAAVRDHGPDGKPPAIGRGRSPTERAISRHRRPPRQPQDDGVTCGNSQRIRQSSVYEHGIWRERWRGRLVPEGCWVIAGQERCGHRAAAAGGDRHGEHNGRYDMPRATLGCRCDHVIDEARAEDCLTEKCRIDSAETLDRKRSQAPLEGRSYGQSARDRRGNDPTRRNQRRDLRPPLTGEDECQASN